MTKRHLATLTFGFLLAAFGLVACDPPMRGASVVSVSGLPRGQVLASYARAQCSDQSDTKSRFVVDYVRSIDGVPFLVERAASPEWVVISNSFVEGSTIVFQAEFASSRPPMLTEYRVPLDGVTPGRFVTSIAYVKLAQPQGVLRAVISAPMTACTLLRVDPATGAVLSSQRGAAPAPTTPVEPIAPSAAAAPSSLVPRSWGFDGKSFKPGDRILVDQNGRSTPATVVQATGRMYLVRYEGTGSGTVEWISPERVTGRYLQ